MFSFAHLFDLDRVGRHASFGQNTYVSVDVSARTLVAPPPDYSWAWALERPAFAPLNICVVPELNSETRTLPNEDELILWFGVPDPVGEVDLFSYLSKDERGRAAKFRFEADRWAFGAAHGALRALLAPMMRCEPRELRFAASAAGKPYLDHDGYRAAVQFSISHTRGCVAVAIANCAVGIDIERRRPIPDMISIARTAFAPEAHAALIARSDWTVRTALFYRYWTLGEAFMKATGEGILQNVPSFAFTSQGAPSLIRVSAGWGPVGRWCFYCKS